MVCSVGWQERRVNQSELDSLLISLSHPAAEFKSASSSAGGQRCIASSRLRALLDFLLQRDRLCHADRLIEAAGGREQERSSSGGCEVQRQ